MRNKIATQAKYHSGFSLIELLIAVALSSIVAIVVVTIFTQSKSTYLEHESNTRLQENGRYAIQLITKAIKSSDFWGCIPSRVAGDGGWPKDDILTKVNGLPLVNPITGVSGTENLAAPGPGGYPTQPDTLSIAGIQRGRSFPLFANHGQNSPAPLTISLGATTASNIQPNDIMIISDCKTAEIFQVTNNVDATATSGVTPNTATIQHGITPFPTVPASPYNNTRLEISNTYKAYKTSVYRGVATNITYSINPAFDHDGNPATPAIPTLMRSDEGGAAQAIVPGIENMQLVFGEDTSSPANGQADRYVTADNVVNFENVVSVRISLVALSPDADSENAAGYTVDGVTVNAASIPADANRSFNTRKVYTTTIAVRNRM